MEHHMEANNSKRSWVWYLLPVFVHIIGGVIAYYALKLDDPRMAKNCLYIGITLTAINLGIFVIMMAISFSFEHEFMPKLEDEIRQKFEREFSFET